MLDVTKRHHPGERAVIERLRRGGRRAQLELVDAVATDMRRTLYRLLGSKAPLELLLEAALLSAISDATEHGYREPLALWTRRIALQVALSFLASVRERRQSQPAPETPQTVRAMLDRAHLRLRNLPPEDQVAFALLYVDGSPLEEAALLMRAAPLTVRRCAERAHQQLLFLARNDRMIAAYLQLSGPLSEAARRFEHLAGHPGQVDPVRARIASRLSELTS